MVERDGRVSQSRQRLTLSARAGTMFSMEFEQARESLSAAEMCLAAGYINSAASRAYYAMFQAAQVALETAGFQRASWSHPGIQATFATELIQRRKIYPTAFRDALASGIVVRQAADYGRGGVSQRIAQRIVRRAGAFVAAVEEVIQS